MECSICGYAIDGEPAEKYILQEKDSGPVIVDMRTCGKPLCSALASYAYAAALAQSGGRTE